MFNSCEDVFLRSGTDFSFFKNIIIFLFSRKELPIIKQKKVKKMRQIISRKSGKPVPGLEAALEAGRGQRPGEVHAGLLTTPERVVAEHS